MIRQAGELREDISILREVVTQSPGGYAGATSYELVCHAKAKAEDAGYRELYAAAAANIKSVTNYWIRYRLGITPGMVLEHLGQRRRIVQVSQGAYDRRWLLLKTTMLTEVDA